MTIVRNKTEFNCECREKRCLQTKRWGVILNDDPGREEAQQMVALNQCEEFLVQFLGLGSRVVGGNVCG